MISQIVWDNSCWGREQSCYLWRPKQKWALGNLMKFPKGRCKVLDPGQNNDTQLDRLEAEWLETALKKRTWWSRWTRSSPSVGTYLATKRVGHVLTCVSKSVVSRLGELIHLIFSALMRPHLEWQGSWHLELRTCKGSLRRPGIVQPLEKARVCLPREITKDGHTKINSVWPWNIRVLLWCPQHWVKVMEAL